MLLNTGLTSPALVYTPSANGAGTHQQSPSLGGLMQQSNGQFVLPYTAHQAAATSTDMHIQDTGGLEADPAELCTRRCRMKVLRCSLACLHVLLSCHKRYGQMRWRSAVQCSRTDWRAVQYTCGCFNDSRGISAAIVRGPLGWDAAAGKNAACSLQRRCAVQTIAGMTTAAAA